LLCVYRSHPYTSHTTQQTQNTISYFAFAIAAFFLFYFLMYKAHDFALFLKVGLGSYVFFASYTYFIITFYIYFYFLTQKVYYLKNHSWGLKIYYKKYIFLLVITFFFFHYKNSLPTILAYKISLKICLFFYNFKHFSFI